MAKNQYETVFILTPVLSDQQMKDTVDKFRKLLTDNGAEFVHEDIWGLRKLAYPIQNKNTGFYALFEYKAEPTAIEPLNVEFRRDERVMRDLTIVMDKHHVAYAERRRSGLIGTKKTNEEAKEGAAA
ncbi:MAG: 30S ribosomal protein S6 [Runella slithyformis]|jgi:small subunit ribosomal protein S6|nr:MAG: 30S ribosomal protein S6 [Runella slithyformis]